MTNIKHFNTIDLTGKKFGKLLVVKQLKERGNRGQIRYECLCECGKKHQTSGESIRSGKSKSCGCLRHTPPNKIKDREQAIWSYLYQTTIVKRNRKWKILGDISLDDFIFFSKEPCYYCGLENSNTAQDRRGWNKNKQVSDTIIKFNGIDRLDSSKRYWSNNVETCCKYCNTAKNTMSEQDFIKFIKRVYEHFRTNHRL
jgi:hypothetical protein